MEAMLLGSAAAEGVPAMFCPCATCRTARANGGKDIRGRTFLFLPPDVLVDFGPDALYAAHRFSLDFSAVNTILYTHSHDDHLIPENLGYAHGVFAGHRDVTLTVYGNDQVRARIQEEMGLDIPRVEVRPAYPFEPIPLPNGQAIPIRSHHKADEHTLNYIITREGRTLLYACDLGGYDEETYDFLRGVRLDAVIMESNYGPGARPAETRRHLGMVDAAAICDRLRQQGTLGPDTPVTVTHFSHGNVLPHVEMEQAAARFNFQVGYDGMRITV